MEKLKTYLRIKQAAEFLGVSQNTLRSWGLSGKIPEHRHPVNQYRLYRVSDLEALLHQAATSADRERHRRRPMRPR